MAEDLRHNGPGEGNLEAARSALVSQCEHEEGNCLYTSTSFYIWLRSLRVLRGALWVGAASASVLAASQILRGDPAFRVLVAGAALAGVILPAIARGLRIDAAIRDYAAAAATFKNLEGEFRRAARVWSHKPYADFETEARKLFHAMNEARGQSLTPPEFCFVLARRKIAKGHYKPDAQ